MYVSTYTAVMVATAIKSLVENETHGPTTIKLAIVLQAMLPLLLMSPKASLPKVCLVALCRPRLLCVVLSTYDAWWRRPGQVDLLLSSELTIMRSSWCKNSFACIARCPPMAALLCRTDRSKMMLIQRLMWRQERTADPATLFTLFYRCVFVSTSIARPTRPIDSPTNATWWAQYMCAHAPDKMDARNRTFDACKSRCSTLCAEYSLVTLYYWHRRVACCLVNSTSDFAGDPNHWANKISHICCALLTELACCAPRLFGGCVRATIAGLWLLQSLSAACQHDHNAVISDLAGNLDLGRRFKG